MKVNVYTSTITSIGQAEYNQLADAVKGNRYCLSITFYGDRCIIGTRTFKVAKTKLQGQPLVDWTLGKLHQVEQAYDKQRKALFR